MSRIAPEPIPGAPSPAARLAARPWPTAPHATTEILDVSHLPAAVMDHRAPIWWGNLLLLTIETTMFGLLVACYFYLWQNFPQWPPPQVDRMPVVYNTLPALPVATVLLAAWLAATAPMLWASRRCLRMDGNAVRLGMAMSVGAGFILIALEVVNLRSVYVRWDDNAYGSIVWVLLGLHLLHAIVSTAENFILTAWLFANGLDFKHARDVRVGATYWYWVATMWVVVYGVIYWAPRLA